MVNVELKIDKIKLDMFNEVCKLSGIEPSTKLRLMIDEEINSYWENHKKRESRNDKVIEIGISFMIPPAY